MRAAGDSEEAAAVASTSEPANESRQEEAAQLPPNCLTDEREDANMLGGSEHSHSMADLSSAGDGGAARRPPGESSVASELVHNFVGLAVAFGAPVSNV